MDDEYFYSECCYSFYKIMFKNKKDLTTHFVIHYKNNFIFVEYVNNEFKLSKRLSAECRGFGKYNGIHNTE